MEEGGRFFMSLLNGFFNGRLTAVKKKGTLSWLAKFRSPLIPSPRIYIVIASMISLIEWTL